MPAVVAVASEDGHRIRKPEEGIETISFISLSAFLLSHRIRKPEEGIETYYL